MLKFHDSSESKKKAHFEMTYTTVIMLNDEIKDKIEETIYFIKSPNQLIFHTIQFY